MADIVEEEVVSVDAVLIVDNGELFVRCDDVEAWLLKALTVSEAGEEANTIAGLLEDWRDSVSDFADLLE